MRNPTCNLCLFGTGNAKPPKTPCLMPTVADIPEGCEVVIVVEQPPVQDDTYGRIFSGKGLTEIRSFFEQNGIEAYCTYALKCVRPSKDVKPDAKHIKICAAEYLAQELARVKPKHIITFGSNAHYGVTGKKCGLDKMGNRYFDETLQAYIYPTNHWIQGLYNQQIKDQIWAHLRQFVAWIGSGAEPVGFEPPVYVADTLRALRVLQKRIHDAPGRVVAADVETQGLDAYAPGKSVRSIQFCWDAKFGGVFVPLGLEDDCYYTNPNHIGRFWQDEPLSEAVEIIREILAEAQCVWHNGKFDRLWLYEWGKREFGKPIEAPHIYMDTLHVAHAIEENRILKLKTLITSELGYPTYDIADKLTKDLDVLIPYAAKDTVATLLLMQKYVGNLQDPDLKRIRRLYAKVTRPMDSIFTEMELQGWPVDRDTCVKLRTVVAAEFKRVTSELHDILDEHKIEATPKAFASPKQLIQIIFKDLGYPTNPDGRLAKTKTGALSTGSDALIHLKGRPFIDKLLEWRGLSKVLSTYIEPMLIAAETRGRITTSYRLTGTVTGRTASGKENESTTPTAAKSSNGMNLQNLPYKKYGTEKIQVRDCIRARPGWSILEADFSQIELRIAGFMSQDPMLMHAYRTGQDVHTIRAMRIMNMDPEQWAELSEEEQKEKRKKAKAANFGFIYGMQAAKYKTYALTDYDLDLSMIECNATRGKFFSDHTGLEPWYGKQERELKRNGYVESLSGRRRHLRNIRLDPESSREARAKYNEAIRMAINCVDFETEALTQRGWVRGPDLTCNDVLLTKNIDSGQLEWNQPTDLKIFADYRGPVTEFKSRSFNAVSTGDHRWPVYNKTTKRNECKTTQQVSRSYGDYRIHRTGQYAGAEVVAWTNDEVEFIGWFLTDGYCRSGRRDIGLCQSKPHTVSMIDALMARLGYSHNRYVANGGEVFWDCHAAPRLRQIEALCPERTLSHELLVQLTNEQLIVLRDTMMLGDGTVGTKDTFHCGRKICADMFQTLCVLTGVASNTRYRDMSSYEPKLSAKMHNSPKCDGYWVTTLLKRDKVQVVPGQVIEHETSSGVWCPVVPNTYFVARRKGQVFITGNTPVQGFASDLKLMSIIEIHDWLNPDEGYMFGEIHDSIVLEVRNECLEKVARKVMEIMSHPRILDELGIELGVPISAECKAGPSLGEAHDLKLAA